MKKSVFILKDQKDRVFTGIMGDGMYYSMEEGDIPKHTIIFTEDDYNDMLEYEPILYDVNDNTEIHVKDLIKIEIQRK